MATNKSGSKSTPNSVGPAGMIKMGSPANVGKLKGADAGPGMAGRQTYILGGKGGRPVVQGPTNSSNGTNQLTKKK